MAIQNISKKKMHYFHTKWRDDHERWLNVIDRWKQQHAEAQRMIDHIQERIDQHEIEMERFMDELDDHDLKMEQEEKDAELEAREDGLVTISMDDHMEQVQLHDRHRQEFHDMKSKHDFLFKLLKKLNDAIDV